MILILSNKNVLIQAQGSFIDKQTVSRYDFKIQDSSMLDNHPSLEEI